MGQRNARGTLCFRLTLFGQEYRRINRGMTVLTASQPFTSALVTSNLAGFRYAWVWRKTVAANFMLLKYQPASTMRTWLSSGLSGARTTHRWRRANHTQTNRVPAPWGYTAERKHSKRRLITRGHVIQAAYRRSQPKQRQRPPHPKARCAHGVPHQDIHQSG